MTTDPLIAARQNKILDAAAKVFANKGFHPTTIKDIAREAGVADGTIYNYFENKTALLFGIFDRMRDSVLQEVDPAEFETADLRGFIKGSLHHPLMALKGENFELFRVIMSEIMVNQELRELYYQRVLEPSILIAEQQIRERYQVQSVLLARTISALVMGLIMQNVMGDQTLSAQWDALPDFLTDLILKGIS